MSIDEELRQVAITKERAEALGTGAGRLKVEVARLCKVAISHGDVAAVEPLRTAMAALQEVVEMGAARLELVKSVAVPRRATVIQDPE